MVGESADLGEGAADGARGATPGWERALKTAPSGRTPRSAPRPAGRAERPPAPGRRPGRRRATMRAVVAPDHQADLDEQLERGVQLAPRRRCARRRRRCRRTSRSPRRAGVACSSNSDPLIWPQGHGSLPLDRHPRGEDGATPAPAGTASRRSTGRHTHRPAARRTGTAGRRGVVGVRRRGAPSACRARSRAPREGRRRTSRTTPGSAAARPSTPRRRPRGPARARPR